MKLSISTLGCPEWGFMKVLEEFKALGCDIEVRGIDGEMEADKIGRFSAEKAEETKALLKEYGVKLISFGTSCKFHAPEMLEENIETAKKAIDVCVRMGIPAIRVFGNDIPDKSRMAETAHTLCTGLKAVCAYGAEKGVYCNLEIHGDFNSVEALELVMAEMKDVPYFGIVWDIAHSDKTVADDYMRFYNVIKTHIRHVHLKDHIRCADGTYKLTLMGEGEIPAKGIIAQLLKDGYDGYFSLEWEKKWVPELPGAEIAFPGYVEYMKAL